MCDDPVGNGKYYVDVLLPLALPQTLSYSVPDEYGERLKLGIRVVVQLRDRKLYSGIVVAVHDEAPTGFEVKDIVNVIDDKPLVDENQLKLWRWLASYYLCSCGEVMKAALPAGLKLESETKVRLADGTGNREPETGTDDEYDEIEMNIIRRVSRKVCTLNELIASSARSGMVNKIKRLVENGTIVVNEEIASSYRIKNKVFVRLHPDICNEKLLSELLSGTAKAPKQEKLLLTYLDEFDKFDYAAPPEIPKDELLKKSGLTSSVLKACENKRIFITITKQTSRIRDDVRAEKTLPELTAAQQKATNEIKSHFGHKPVMLKGVTSSGKTEIYIRLIDEQLRKGKQVFYLLPEIALTTQIIDRLRNVFGDKVGVYHSRFSDAERVEIYNNLLKRKNFDDKSYVVLGVRSSLFLPFADLGLIIVDEEHETSYKQYEPAPRYNARDSAIVLASIHGADILLGSATPAIESYYNAKTGKYGLVELSERYGDAQLPTVKVIDMIKARKKKQVVSHFSQTLLDAMRNTLERKEQIILFQNRRGFSSFVQCGDCGYVPHCKFCDVSSTYHKHNDMLICHYCGFTVAAPKQCPECGSREIKTQGFGTEKIEDELAVLMPDARVARLDLDSTRSKNAYERILYDFENGDIDILIGTQMITKGLDFANVSLVGIMNADNMLNFADFRAYERSFQLMSQVAGRAGRKDKPGKVLIQTSMPDNPVIKTVMNHDYTSMFAAQIEERREFVYPPYCRLAVVTLKHVKKETVDDAARAMHHILYSVFAENVAGPQPPPVGRIRNKYLMSFRVKMKRDSDIKHYKQLLQECFAALLKSNERRFASVQIVTDIDPI